MIVEGNTDGVEILDRYGRQTGIIAGRIGGVGWLDSATIAALIFDGPTAIGQIHFFDVTGVEKGSIEGDYERIVVSPGNDLVAAVSPAAADENVGRSYRVWDSGTLAPVRDGEPLTWSSDGSLLALLLPTDSAPGMGGDQGTLAISRDMGATLTQIAGWNAETYGVFAFSNDDNYLAACISDANSPGADTARVIDVDTESVSISLGTDCDSRGVAWGGATGLYLSDGIGTGAVWSPGAGLTPIEGTKGSFVTPSLTGELAVWTNGGSNSVLTTVVGNNSDQHSLPGLNSVNWSPDGLIVAAVSAAGGDGSEMTLMSVAAEG